MRLPVRRHRGIRRGRGRGGRAAERGGLLVVGDIVTDTVACHDGPLTPNTDTAAAISVRPGGSAANTAAWAAALGTDVTLLARVGADSARWHERELRRHGVRPVLRVDAERPTAQVIALVDESGERTMVTDRGAGGALSPDDWDDALLDGVSLLHLSGYTFFTASGQRLAEVALEAARSLSHRGHGISVSVDPASTGFLRTFGVERFLAATQTCDFLLPNEVEALYLTGEADPERAASRLGGTYRMAVVKRGADGVLVGQPGRRVQRFPAQAVSPTRVTDTVGAGDAFAGAFLACAAKGLLGDSGWGRDPEWAVAAGCRAGALAVTVPGGRPPGTVPGHIVDHVLAPPGNPGDLPSW